MSHNALTAVAADKVVCVEPGLFTRLSHLDICPGFATVLADIDYLVIELDFYQSFAPFHTMSVHNFDYFVKRQNGYAIWVILDD